MDSINNIKLRWIHRLRWIAIVLQFLLLPFAIRFGYLIKENISFYLLVVIVTFIFNIKKIWSRFSLYKNISFQTSFDLIIFTLLILLSSKMENPFWPLIYFHAGMTAFLVEPKKDYQVLPFVFGSIGLVHALSIQYYSSIVFILIPQWLILIAIWFFTRKIAFLLINQHKLISDLNEKEYKQSKLKSIGLLSSGILHEIGTPLNTIRLKTNRLKQKPDKFTPRDSEILDQSLLAIEKVVDLLNQAQFETEQSITQTVQINTYIRDLKQNWDKEFPNLCISLSGQDECCTVQLSKVNFSIVMKVILNNALEAGAKKVNIKLVLGDRLKIIIQDDGPGFNDFILQNFKAPYTSTKGQGRGIGLFNANLSLESMGGSLSIQNNDGALITIELQECNED